MCKYCRHLKALREKDLKTFQNIIKKWKNHTERLNTCLDLLCFCYENDLTYYKDFWIAHAKKLINTKYIGK